MEYIDFKNPPIGIRTKLKKLSSLEISIEDVNKNDLEKYFKIDNLEDDFTIKQEFSQIAYRNALRNKLLGQNKAFILRFFLHQFELNEDPLEWIDGVSRTIHIEEKEISEFYSEASDVFLHEEVTRKIDETIELILNEPRYHFDSLKVNQQKAIKLNLSLPQIRLINQLLIKSKIIKGSDLPLLEQVLSLNFSSLDSKGRISKYALANKRMKFDAKHTESVTILLNYMKSEISKIEKDL
jgi:hypothetical protein